MSHRLLLLGLLLASLCFLFIAWRRGETQPPGPVAVASTGTALQITLGHRDQEPTQWDGEIAVTPGQVIRLYGRSVQGDRVEGNRWAQRSRRQPPQQQQIRLVRVIAVVDAPPSARVSVTTTQGNFEFALGETNAGERRMFLNARVGVERVPAITPVVTERSEDDFPAASVAPDGRVWVAWVAYQQGTPVEVTPDTADFSSLVTRQNGDQVKLAVFDGRQWSSPLDVTPPQQDVWRPTVTVDGRGDVWVVWSQNRDGNWDVMARRYDPAGSFWNGPRRLTTATGADINAAAVTDRDGQVWVVWQGWRRDNFEILARQVGRGSEILLTRTPANEWNPVAGVDSQGVGYVAFDTYEAGNYDVKLVRDAFSSRPQTIAVAASDRFEARASLAIDPHDRVWVAYEEADANWGKDQGQRWSGPSGVPFYDQRTVRVRCYAGGSVLSPAGDLESNLTPRLRIRKSFPRIAVDAQGRVWLAFRHHGTGDRVGTQPAAFQGEIWSSWVCRYEGDTWSPAIALPESDNLVDNRPALAPLVGTGVLAVYSSDHRDSVAPAQANNDLHLALLTGDGAPTPPQLAPVPDAPLALEPIHPNEPMEVARVRDYRVRVGGRSYRLLRGEFHRHTEMSSHRDQDGPLEEMWRYGLDVAKMDWIGNGDHMNGGREYKWWLVQKQTDIYLHAPVFVAQHTYERSAVYPNGHRNVMFARRGIRPLPFGTLEGTPEAGTPDTKQLYAYLRFFDGICASHTSATGMGTDWRDNDPLVEPVVEIYQGHRQNYEHPGAPASNSAADSIGGFQPAGYVWTALGKGYRLGFQVSSDHVSTHISYAVALAERNSREAIVEAFTRRRCYGANDNIILDVRCGDRLMGEEFATCRPPRLEIAAVGTHPIARVDIVKDNTYAHSFEPHQQVVELTWEDAAPTPGRTSYYYVRIQQANGAIAWASPMWIRYEP